MSSTPEKQADEPSDQILVAAVLGGDKRAFNVLVRRYESVVAATAVGMVGAGGEADDVAQEAMIKLYRCLPDFRGESSLKTWLTRVTVNLAIDLLRRRKRWLSRMWASDEHPLDELVASCNEPCQLEGQQLIQAAFQALKPEFRAVAVLRLVQGYSTDETAEILTLPQGTVLSRLARAKKQLQETLTVDHNG